MPLIRYDTGNLAIKLPLSEYPKDRRFHFPHLKKVIGRNTDIIKTPEGKHLIVHTFTGLFEFYKEIKQFKVIQEEIASITIEYIASEHFEIEVLSKIENAFREKTFSDIIIKWEKVSKIENTPSGKPQIIENRLIKQSLINQI